MEEIEDKRPTAERSPEIIKEICGIITQAFNSWELKVEEEER